MDYGKLAYTKAEEIERYLKRSSDGDNRTSASVSFYPRVALESGYEPCTVYGSGNVAVTASMTFSAPKGADGIKVSMYAGNSLVGYTTVTVPAGGRASATLLSSVYPAGGEKIRVAADGEGLILEEMSVLALGSDAFVNAGGRGCKSDCVGERTYFAREKDGCVILSEYGKSAEVNAVHGTVFDIAASDDGIDLFCCDDDGNAWGVCYDTELRELGRVYLGSGAQKVALGNYGYGKILAAIMRGKLYFAYSESGFEGVSDWTEADFGEGADDVFLSRGEATSALLFRKDEKIFAKVPSVSGETFGAVRASLSFAFV